MVRCGMLSKISFARKVSAFKRVTKFRLTAIDVMVISQADQCDGKVLHATGGLEV